MFLRGGMLTGKTSVTFRDVDFMFENSPVKIVANRNYPEIELAGLKVGPFEEGREYEVRFWIAEELERAGIARLREEELLDPVKLRKIHWKERIQSVKSIVALPENFYPKLRRYLTQLKENAARDPEKIRAQEKALSLSQDIVNCRLKKIVSLASAPAQTGRLLQNLTSEERALYEHLHAVINEWRTKVLRGGEKT